MSSNQSGNSVEAVLCRLAGEIAYTSKRLCIRNAKPIIAQHIDSAARYVEAAIAAIEEEKAKDQPPY